MKTPSTYILPLSAKLKTLKGFQYGTSSDGQVSRIEGPSIDGSSMRHLTVRVAIEIKNPTKIDMIHLSNTLFVAKPRIIDQTLSLREIVAKSAYREIYMSNDWLKNMNTLRKLEMSRNINNDLYLDLLEPRRPL